MNLMDIDETVDVPDTPDRLAKQTVNERSGVKEGSHSPSNSCLSVRQKFYDDGAEIEPVVVDRGNKRLPLRPPKCTGSFGNSLHPINSAALSMASSSSARNALRPVVTDGGSRRLPLRPPKCTSSSSNSLHPITSGFSMASSSSSKSPVILPKKIPSCQSFVDLTERSPHRPGPGNSLPGEIPGSGRFESSKRSGLANRASSPQGMANSSTVLVNVSEGTDNGRKIISSIGNGQGVEFADNIQSKPGISGSLSVDPIVSPRVHKQKRLVRNGCISPNNIAKAKQLAVKDNIGFVSVSHDNNGSIDNGSISPCVPPISFDIRELVADDHNSHTRKGKGVMNYPCTSKDTDLKKRHVHSRQTSYQIGLQGTDRKFVCSSSSLNEKAIESSDYIKGSGKRIEESGGWRCTRSRTKELNPSSSDEKQLVMREMDVPSCNTQHHMNRMARREKGSSFASGDAYPKDPNLVSCEHVSSPPLGQTVSHPRTRSGLLNGHPSAVNTLIKRQRSTLSSLGECSASDSNNSEAVYLSSSAELSNLGLTSRSLSILQPTTEVDEPYPDLRHNAHNEDARARQVEADECLARELQEQLYNEVPVLGVGEVDAHIALALQHQDDSSHAFPSRGSSIAHMRRQSQSRASSNLSRRGSVARASTMGRMTRLRSRFPGPPRTLLPSRGRTSMFPANMDVDMRMHILGALEAFNDMEVGTGIFQTHRDFNENDYETLLILDENNDQRGGASVHQINGLPQSTVQSGNFDEACAICLETPTIGDTIRHLPCLHKFHKDCIDPWLRRRTSCPICKSSIT